MRWYMHCVLCSATGSADDDDDDSRGKSDMVLGSLYPGTIPYAGGEVTG